MLCGCSNNGFSIYDGNGNLITVITDQKFSNYNLKDTDKSAYIDIVIDEVVDIISQSEKCTEEKAKEIIVQNKYSVYTFLNNDVYNSVKNTYNTDEYNGLNFGCAVTNNSGQLLAAYSGGDNNINFSVTKTPPYSSIKPLSVYTPAIDSGIAYWSKTYTDTPVKKVTDNDGKLVDWPSNANGKYADKDITVYEAIKKSLNTISVKCLKDYGVTRSVSFLKTSFDFPLEPEEAIISQYGEDEVLGNLGMGYLREGVTPVDMAGYYQIFANGGKYFEPTTIYEIKDRNGNNIYKRNVSINQVIKKSTTDIMNHLLQEVVSEGGTGAKACIDGIEVGGKTGTGENGNWFVGFTPEYTCAVWHGTQLEKNNCCEIFSNIIKNISNKKITSFSDGSEIKKAVYCCKSGYLSGNECTENAVGYFDVNSIPEKCRKH